MGLLELPSNGPVYLDASVFIYSVERIQPYQALIEPIWEQAQAGRFTVVSSELVVSEVLVRPLREGNRLAETLFRSLLGAKEVGLLAATRSLWEETARLRANSGLKTPDALHAASALQAGCTLFVTNDADFRRVEGLPVTILDDLLLRERS
ncbi:MAG: type II toxin-antitoxin system VapC family toxin [Chloroflexi bacterium]|nr:type II toxin-antitoxin system VapC family toxin [Chloroflexota bacterium]MYE39663.1 type II toxin-antitoxin system VapC family toxin [Chloroflexota bacterium]